MSTAHLIGIYMHAREVRGTPDHRTDLRTVNDTVPCHPRCIEQGVSHAEHPDTGEMRQLTIQQKGHKQRGCAS